MFNLRSIVGYYDSKYPSIDPSTPWAEFNYYIEACNSLKVTPSIRRYFGYRKYLKSVGII